MGSVVQVRFLFQFSLVFFFFFFFPAFSVSFLIAESSEGSVVVEFVVRV